MKKIMTDWRLIIGFILAHPLIFFSFEEKKVFWYLFTAAMLVLISYSIFHEELEKPHPRWRDLVYGLFSGVVIYGIFWAGNILIDMMGLPLSGQIRSLYRQFSPDSIWHYLVLVLIIVPGEEIFWRGFIQKRILKHATVRTSIILSTLLYASVQFYAGQFILVLAAIVGGLCWGSLYAWKRSIRLVIVSHLVFSLLLFGLLPLY